MTKTTLTPEALTAALDSYEEGLTAFTSQDISVERADRLARYLITDGEHGEAFLFLLNSDNTDIWAIKLRFLAAEGVHKVGKAIIFNTVIFGDEADAEVEVPLPILNSEALRNHHLVARTWLKNPAVNFDALNYEAAFEALRGRHFSSVEALGFSLDEFFGI